MDSLCHADTVKAVMLVRDAATGMLRRPTDDDLGGIRDSDAYDAVAVARGISRCHAAFERFTFDRTGKAMAPDTRAIAYWHSLDHQAVAGIRAALPVGDDAVAARFAEGVRLREQAHGVLGEDLTNDYLRATTRATGERDDAAYQAGLALLRILASKGD